MGRGRASMENENQIKVSNWAVLQMCKQNEDMKIFCHRLERKSFLDNKKCFFLNLLQKLIAKVLYQVSKLFSGGIWTKYICFQRLWEVYQAASCASGKLGIHQIRRGTCSLCLAFSLLWLQFLRGLFLNSSIAVNVTCDILAAKLHVGGRHVESEKGAKNIVFLKMMLQKMAPGYDTSRLDS